MSITSKVCSYMQENSPYLRFKALSNYACWKIAVYSKRKQIPYTHYLGEILFIKMYCVSHLTPIIKKFRC